MKKIIYNQKMFYGTERKSDILNNIIKIEKEITSWKISTKKGMNFISISAALLEIVRAESNKNNKKLSMFDKFMNEQALMSNSNYNERIHLVRSFAILQEFMLHSNRFQKTYHSFYSLVKALYLM